MDGAMRPPPVPQKAKRPQVAPPADEPAPKRIELGEELPDEVSREDIQQMLDKADELHVEALTETSLKRMHLQFERKVKLNRELRIKHVDDPDKFLKSEVDLDEEIKKFTLVATHPELYAALLKLETLPLLVGMLNHVNTDIAVDVFEVLSELTDPEVLSEVEDPEGFVKAIFDAQLCQMTVDVLARIDETVSDEDFKAVTNGLSMIENLADLMPQETCRQFLEIPTFLPWLIKRLRAQGMDYNKVYASEILGIVLQNSERAREEMVKLEGVDKLLRGIAAYRKRDPADSEEAEYVQNMFDCICSLMLLKTNQIAFGSLQGLELMIRMMREKVFAATLALKLVDHSLRHCPENCQIFVEKLGLKVLFAIFMKKGAKTKKQSEAKEVEEHVTSIVQSLCRYCTGTPVARVLNKFVESNFEKLERLLEMHEEYHRSVQEADRERDQGLAQKIDRELEVNEEEQLFLDRCDAGLFTLQQVDLILVRLVNMGNRQATEEIGKLMDVKGVKLEEIKKIVLEYCTNLGQEAQEERGEVISYLRAMLTRYGGDASAVEEPAVAGSKTPEDLDGAVTPDEADPNQVTDDEAPKEEKETKEKKDRTK
ncbi:unnamed protein product [Cladocopium goreaui]|uniref:Beta-catenin-like protein 1 N-terminal domain-containing protein n=1 Tax=Cladocopium goreaui TaxID=2562237 RepID=A0A9P1C238_9DINO|nr:unnamed protein product [Cladocopium goreaui]